MMRLSRHLAVDENRERVYCMVCETDICDPRENWRLHVLYYDKDPGEIFVHKPQLRAPSKDRCIYREFYCPNCATLFDVEPLPIGYETEAPRQDIKLLRYR